jgi:hypothetical protein
MFRINLSGGDIMSDTTIKQPPPYHLRLNKAVDRFLLIELLKRLDQLLPTSFTENGTYCGFGGPYLEDIRLIHEYFPSMKLYSVEKNEETYKRQKFHKPCNKVELYNGQYDDFLRECLANKENHVVCWLDYTDLPPSVISDFTATINMLPNFAVIRMTVPARLAQHKAKEMRKPSKNFEKNFGEFFSLEDIGDAFHNDKEFVRFLCCMFKNAACKCSSKLSGKYFIPISSSYYHDTVTMFSLTGILYISDNDEKMSEDRIIESLKDWEFANELNPEPCPEEIDLPILSTKERLRLQHLLPSMDSSSIGECLYNELGYNLSLGKHNSDADAQQTKKLLDIYARFYRYYPYFIRGNP